MILNITIASYFMATAISAGLVFVFWRHRDDGDWVRPSIAIALSTAVWAFAQAMELYVPTVEAKMAWGHVQYLGIVWLSPAWFVLAVQRTNWRKWLSPRVYGLLAIIPAITIILIFTNERHYLMWSSVTLDTDFVFPVLNIFYGGWFIVQTAYAAALQFVGIVALVSSHGRHSKVYRQQNLLLMVALLFPILAVIFRISGISFFVHVDVTPLILTISVSLLAVYTLTFHLFDITPVTRMMIMNSLRVGIIIINEKNQIVEINLAAQTMLGLGGIDLMGQEATRLQVYQPEFAPVCALDVNAHQEIRVLVDDVVHYYDVEISAMENDRGEINGRILTITDTTERKLAETAVREGERRYRILAENSTDIIWTMDMDMKTTYMSPSAEHHLGYSVEEMKSIAFNELVSPASLEIIFEQIPGMLTRRKNVTVEIEEYHKNGDIIPFEINMAILRDDNDEPIGMIGSSRNITERKEAEAATQQQNEFLNIIIDSLANPFYVIDAKDYSIQIANKAARELGVRTINTCYALTHLRDTPCDSLEHPCPLALLRDSKEPTIVEHIHFDSDGNPRNMEIHAYPIFNDAGEVIQMIEYSLDITERKLAEAQLRQLSRAVEQSGSSIVITNLDGAIEFVNPAFTRTTGYSLEEVVGNNPRIMQSGYHDPLFYEQMWSVLTEGGVWQEEMVNRKKDGSLYWEHVTISPIKDGGEIVTGYLAIKDDITERKQAETQLRQLSRAVEQSGSTIVITNLDGSIEFVNPAFCLTTGYTAEEVMGQNPRILQSGVHDADYYTEMWETLLAGDVWQGEIRNKKKDGTLFWEHATLSPVVDNDGVITHYLAIKDDISERKRAEAETQLLLSVSNAIHDAPDFNGALETILVLIATHTEWEYGEMWLPNKEKTRLIHGARQYSQSGDTSLLREINRVNKTITFKRGEGMAGRIWESRQPEWYNRDDATEEKNHPRAKLTEMVGIQSGFGVPIMVDDEVLAVIMLAMYKPREKDKRTEALITAVAAQLGAALQQKTAQAALVENEYQLRRLTDNISDFISQTDKNGILEYISPSWTRGLGYTEKDVLGTSVFKYMHPDDVDIVIDLFTKSVVSGTSAAVDFRFQHKDGHYLHLSANGTVLMDVQGELMGAVFGAVDITKRKQAEGELQIAYKGIEAKVAELTAVNSLIQALSRITNLQDALNLVTRTMVEQLNSYQCRIALLSRGKTELATAAYYSKNMVQADMVGMTIPLEGNLHSQRLFRKGQPIYISHAQTNPDTEPYTRELMREQGVYSTLLLPLLARGKVIGSIAVDSELSDRAFSDDEIRLAETIAAQIANAIANTQLSSEEKRARRKLEVAYQGIEEKVAELTAVNSLIQALSFTTNLQEALDLVTYTMVERFAAFQCGIALINEERTGITVTAQYSTNLGQPDPIGLFFPFQGNKYTKRVFDTAKPVYMSHAQTSPDVEPFTRQVMREQGVGSILLLPLLAHGEVIGSIGIDSELPDRAFTDEEIRLAETIAAQIANVIANTRLFSQQQKAQREAEEANKAKSVFLANMSHELRTPMNAILGFAQLMQRDPDLTPIQQGRLQTIGRSGEHLLELINDVLEMSKIEAGRMEISETSFDLHKMLRDSVSLLAMKAQEKELSLDLHYPMDLPQYIRTDEAKLRQVLINLMGNAVKFTEKGDVQVSVQHSVGKGDQPSRMTGTGFLKHQSYTLTFIVKDSGNGINENELETIFDPFIQAKKEHGQQGTGLGLPISRRFIQMMGGDIYAENQIEGGAIFTFDIQASSVAAGDVPTAEQLRKVVGMAAGQKRYRILLVEDNEINRTLLTQTLEPVGFDVREAENGRVAINHASRWKPDIILMDMRMPVMGGLEATREIKVMQPNTPIIALTAGAFDYDRMEALSAGCDDFMAKPVNIQMLFQLLEKHTGVQFIYDDAHDEQLQVVDAPLSVEDLTAVSSPLRQELHTAIILADRRKAATLIDKIRVENGRLADKLDALLNAFQFDKLAELTQ